MSTNAVRSIVERAIEGDGAASLQQERTRVDLTIATGLVIVRGQRRARRDVDRPGSSVARATSSMNVHET